jgi:hypothetical protein
MPDELATDVKTVRSRAAGSWRYVLIVTSFEPTDTV